MLGAGSRLRAARRRTPGRVTPLGARGAVFISLHHDAPGGRAGIGHAIAGPETSPALVTAAAYGVGVTAVCMLISIPLAAYYNYTQLFLESARVANIAATQTLGQMSEIAFMILMPWFLVRLGVKRVGCSGFAYTMDYADQVGENDVVFEFVHVRGPSNHVVAPPRGAPGRRGVGARG